MSDLKTSPGDAAQGPTDAQTLGTPAPKLSQDSKTPGVPTTSVPPQASASSGGGGRMAETVDHQPRVKKNILLFFVLLAVAAVAGHSLSKESYKYLHEDQTWPISVLAALSAVLFAAAAYILYRRRFELEGWLPLLAVILGILAAHWLGLSLHDLAHGSPTWALVAASAVGLCVSIYLAERIGQHLTLFRTLDVPIQTQCFLQARQRKIRALVLVVSKNQFQVQQPVDKSAHTLEVVDVNRKNAPKPKDGEEAISKPIRLMGGLHLDEDIAAADGYGWNWQQILRAIKPYHDAGDLKQIVLIVSKSKPSDQWNTPKQKEVARGSDVQFKDCEKILRLYFAADVVGIASHDVNLEDFNQMITLFRDRILADLAKTHKIDASEVVFDVTGGYKVASIAGAVLTLNSSALFQYVQTEGEMKPIIYDARIDLLPRVGG